MVNYVFFYFFYVGLLSETYFKRIPLFYVFSNEITKLWFST